MALKHTTKRSNDLRAPAMPRGTAMIVTRYREDVAKVALVHPEDLAMLEESHEILELLGDVAPASLGAISRKARLLEDRPRADALIEDPERIAAILES